MGALAGLCPACLLAQGANTETAEEGRTPGFSPPPLDKVAELFPQLEVIALIGTGGMGAVYKARQPGLDRFVALKILPSGTAAGPNFAERFNREARALARLSHPNIVAVHEFGQAGEFHYFVMEYVDGANLRRLEHASRLSPREALHIIPQICDALQYAHDEGVVHRDIKPENVLIDRKGRVKIADFGLAKILGRDAETMRLTQEGQVMGTPHYMAPEQIERPLAVDHRADIYSLGVVLYEMLTGDLPLGKFPPPSRKVEVDVRFDEVVLRALENDPERRYQKASEVKSKVATISDTPFAPPATGTLAQEDRDIRSPERFSRKAIIGACWAPFFFLAFALMFITYPVTVAEGGPARPAVWLQWLLILTVLIPGAVAPFGTTILGWVAVSEIKRARGRIGGLPMAIFDGLLFPLLTLDVFLYLALASVFDWAKSGSTASFFRDLPFGVVVSGISAVCLFVDFLIIGKVWQAVRAANVRPQPAADRWWNRKSGAAVIGLACLAVLVVGGYYHRAGAAKVRVDETAVVEKATGILGADLPGGGRAEVLAVGYRDPAPNQWWRPGGNLITNELWQLENPGEARSMNTTNRDLIFRITGGPQGLSAPLLEFTPNMGFVTSGSVTRNNEALDGATGCRIAISPHVDSLDLHMGFGLEPWRTIATHTPQTHAATYETRPGDPSWNVSFNNLSETTEGAQVTVVMSAERREWKRRIVAVDHDGKEHANPSGQGTPGTDTATWAYTFRDLPLAKVLEFRVQVQPVYWIGFNNIRLNPQSPLPAPNPLKYGPVRELTVRGCIDFDTGKLQETRLGLEPNILEDVNRRRLWFEQNGFDAVAQPGELQTIGMIFAALENTDWDSLSPVKLIARLHQNFFQPSTLKPGQNVELPATFAFRTREGGTGILQLLAFDEAKAGATVRYKLVQQPALETP